MQPTQNATDLTDEQLRELYAYPSALDRPWVRINFIASIDGAIAVDGASGGLGTPIDHRVYHVLRELADVVLVAAGTVRAENYGRARIPEAGRARRVARGQTPEPPIVVVTGRADLDPASRLLVDDGVAPIVLTSSSAPEERRAALAAAGATVLALDAPRLSAAAIVATLAERGLRRVLCEGGPHLVGELLSGGAVDEVCLTTAPTVVGGDSARFALAPAAVPTPMTRALLLGDADGTVLTRWVRAARP